MNKEYYKAYSHQLGREMEVNIYGHAGKPCLVFPAQNGRFFDFENFGMVDACASFIEEGKLQLFCVDSIDGETWSNEAGDPRWRIERHEAWYRYICEELVPYIYAKMPVGMGVSMPAGF